MRVFAYSATERGIRQRNAAIISMKRQSRLQIQRELYEAKLEEAQHIAEIRQRAAENALSMLQAMKEQGYSFRHTYREIERRACKVFGISKDMLRSNRRSKHVVLAKHFVMYWCVRLTNLSTPQIGKLMGGKDHTSVLHGKNTYPEKRALMGRKLPPAL